MNEQDPMMMFLAAANHAEEVKRAAGATLLMLVEAYNADGPGGPYDGRKETIAAAAAMVNAAAELAAALWAVVEATRENAEVGR